MCRPAQAGGAERLAGRLGHKPIQQRRQYQDYRKPWQQARGHGAVLAGFAVGRVWIDGCRYRLFRFCCRSCGRLMRHGGHAVMPRVRVDRHRHHDVMHRMMHGRHRQLLRLQPAADHRRHRHQQGSGKCQQEHKGLETNRAHDPRILSTRQMPELPRKVRPFAAHRIHRRDRGAEPCSAGVFPAMHHPRSFCRSGVSREADFNEITESPQARLTTSFTAYAAPARLVTPHG